MHARRWLTALIILPFLLLVLLKGGHFLFVLLLLLVNGLAQWEFLGMFSPDADTFRRLKAIILGSVLLLSFCTAQRASTLCNPSGPLFVLVGILFLLFLFYLIAYSHIADLSRELMVNVLALLYIPLLLGHFVWLRYLSDGQWWVLWLLLVIMAGDTGAFYAGRTWGKTKLYPAVSPGKTWAGVVGGTAAALVVGLVLGRWALPGVSLGALAVAGAAPGRGGAPGGPVRVHAQAPGPGQGRLRDPPGPRRHAGPPGQPALRRPPGSLCPLVPDRLGEIGGKQPQGGRRFAFPPYARRSLIKKGRPGGLP